MKKIFVVLVTVISFISCSKFENPHYYDGKHFGSTFTAEGLTINSSVSSPDYAGGVSVILNIENKTGKTIKYLTVVGDMRNCFGDKVECEVWCRTGMEIKITGPIYNSDVIVVQSNNCFYNPTAQKYCMNVIDIEYLN